MTIPLRALKTFLGRPGESRSKDGVVQMGEDFNAADKRRADDLEIRGLAVPLIKPRPKADIAPANKMEPKLQNKAAEAGPLPSTGGPTGEASGVPSSSGQGQAQPRPVSRRRKDERE